MFVDEVIKLRKIESLEILTKKEPSMAIMRYKGNHNNFWNLALIVQ